MGVIGGAYGVRILRRLSPAGQGGLSNGVPPAYRQTSKLQQLFGASVWDEIRGRIVVDFGCGEGREVVELAEHGARHVIGIDARPLWLDRAATLAAARGVADRCTFVRRWTRAGSPT
jgi:2-polyprenyl-3-methyl-5-hydroxy-6-metoxy-1,4-benzoquinol methylase